MKTLKPYQQIELMMQGQDPDDDFGFADLSWDWEAPIYDDEQPPILRCNHNWKPTVLITSTVYDCTKCGIKKEKVDTVKF